ncbi:autotransporter domain-containing protein [Rhizobium sp. RAF56]|uniref:autotransporter outer membrane beta-barrel domain-containing protein n=1 Tax=Rhizobium sp. RAF56 TaxID=3233062 RepID=UPI003F95EF8C
MDAFHKKRGARANALRRLCRIQVEGDRQSSVLLSRLAGTIWPGLVVLSVAGTPVSAFADSCKSSGGLRFLGVTSDSSSSVWLSGTSAGSFGLDAAQGNQTVDEWTKAKRGLHVSTSPVVSNGNGGTHKLYDLDSNKPCLIDTQNQKGGFVFPPNLTLPPFGRPGGGHAVPPIGKLFPDFAPPSFQRPSAPLVPAPPGGGGGIHIGGRPPHGLTPTVPPGGLKPRLPGGVKPPIAKLPPHGLTPTAPPGALKPGLPGGVKPPIAKLPPNGLMPTLPPGGVVPNLPDGVVPPIATLPPEGMMPTLPGQPGGVMPTLPGRLLPNLPGGVAPPIATLPPEGMMPTLPGQPGGVMPTLPGRLLPNLPGGVAPPIATLPPEGMMPTLPGQPGGVMPNLPGGVVPPIATLPPGAGLLPTVPGQVVPPIATLVPPGEVTPAVPTSPQPGGVLPRGPRLPAAPAENTTAEREGIARPEARCIERGSEQATAENQKKLPLCEDLRARMAPATNEAPNAEVPLTAGRDLIPPTLWNVWALTEGTSVSDHRYGLDNNSLAGTLTMGLDRKITDDVVLGVYVAVDKSRNESFGDSLRTDTNGFSIGPYVAVRLSPHWAIDTSLSYGHTNSDLRLLGLSGNFASQQYEASANLNGQYDIGEAYARPKLSVTYSRNISDSYSLAGSILGRPINSAWPIPPSTTGLSTQPQKSAGCSAFPTERNSCPMPNLAFTTNSNARTADRS